MGVIKKGTIICLETGEYSDRFVAGHFLVLRDIPHNEWNAIMEKFETGHGWLRQVDLYKMTAEMIRLGMIEDADNVIIHHADERIENAYSTFGRPDPSSL